MDAKVAAAEKLAEQAAAEAADEVAKAKAESKKVAEKELTAAVKAAKKEAEKKAKAEAAAAAKEIKLAVARAEKAEAGLAALLESEAEEKAAKEKAEAELAAMFEAEAEVEKIQEPVPPLAPAKQVLSVEEEAASKPAVTKASEDFRDGLVEGLDETWMHSNRLQSKKRPLHERRQQASARKPLGGRVSGPGRGARQERAEDEHARSDTKPGFDFNGWRGNPADW